MSSNSTSATKASKKDSVPGVLQRWNVLAYDVLPAWGLAATPERPRPVLFSLCLLTSVVFGSLAVLFRYYLVEFLGLDPKEKSTVAAACSMVSMIHSSNLVWGLFWLFWTQPYEPAAKISQAPKWWQDGIWAILQFCTGYMIYDFFFMIISSLWIDGGFSSEDTVFVFHHVATIFYMTAVQLVQAGHFSAMGCMFLGELTNPFHNLHMILEIVMKYPQCQTPFFENLNYINNFIFALLYFFIRAILGIPFCVHVSYHLLHKGYGNGIPRWMLGIFVTLIWAITLGSLPWVMMCLDILKPYFVSEVMTEAGGSEL